MKRKYMPGVDCCGNTTCEDACASVDPIVSASVSIENGTSDNSFNVTFATSEAFDCTVSASECRLKDPTKIDCGECVSEWTDAGIVGINCNCGRCTYVPDDPDDPIPFPTPLGAPFPATTFTRVELSNRTGWKVCEWRQLGYRVAVTISPGSTVGSVVVAVYYEVGAVRFYNWLFASQFRYRIHSYACPGGPLPVSTGSWIVSANPFPLEDPPYPCEVLKPINGMAGVGCDTDVTGTPVCTPATASIVGYNQTLTCHPDPVCGYIVANDPVYWFTTTIKTSRWYDTPCSSACESNIPSAPFIYLYPQYFTAPCTASFDEQSVRYARTYSYVSEDIPCEDLLDGPITLNRVDGVTSDETIELVPEYDLNCVGGLGYICGSNDPLVIDSTSLDITVPWQVTVTLS